MYNLQTFLGKYKVGQLIYEDVLSRNCFLSKKESSALLTKLKEKGFLTQIYKLHCIQCNTSQYEIFNNLHDAEENYCEECNEFIPKDSVIKYYKVINPINCTKI